MHSRICQEWTDAVAVEVECELQGEDGGEKVIHWLLRARARERICVFVYM